MASWSCYSIATICVRSVFSLGESEFTAIWHMIKMHMVLELITSVVYVKHLSSEFANLFLFHRF